MGSYLSARAIASFQENGFYSPIPVYTEAETRELRRQFEALDQIFGAKNARGYIADLHLIAHWAWDAVHDTRIVDPVTDVLGPNVLLWSLNWFIKEPRDQKFVSYHQDATYWGLEPHDVVTAWLALSNASEATGPMKFVPGSHLEALREHKDTFGENNLLSRGQVIEDDIDEKNVVLAPLLAGEMSLHHVRLIHGSTPNQTDTRRIGMVFRYCATHVTQTKLRDTAVLVHGEDHFGNFDWVPKPEVDFGEAELARQKNSLRRMQQAIHSKDYENRVSCKSSLGSTEPECRS